MFLPSLQPMYYSGKQKRLPLFNVLQQNFLCMTKVYNTYTYIILQGQPIQPFAFYLFNLVFSEKAFQETLYPI